MSSTMHRHNPYQQSLPTAYLTQQSQQQGGYHTPDQSTQQDQYQQYPDDLQLDIHLRRRSGSITSASIVASATAPPTQYAYSESQSLNGSYKQHHSLNQAAGLPTPTQPPPPHNGASPSQQPQFYNQNGYPQSTPNPTYNGNGIITNNDNNNSQHQVQHSHHQQHHDNRYQPTANSVSESDKQGALPCVPAANNLSNALCFPSAMMDQLIHGPDHNSRGNNGQSNQQKHQYQQYHQDPNAQQNGAVGYRDDVPNMVDGVVLKTSEKVIREELNGRVPYIAFPPLAEMQQQLREAQQQIDYDDQVALQMNPSLPVGPDGKIKKSYQPVFFGQVLFSTTQTHLNWLMLDLVGVLPNAVSNHTPGCFTCYFDSMDDCHAVITLNKRILFDSDGVWYAQNTYQSEQLTASANFWKRQKQQQANAEKNGKRDSATAIPRLPRGSMVVELPATGTTGNRNTQGQGGNQNKNKSHNGVQNG